MIACTVAEIARVTGGKLRYSDLYKDYPVIHIVTDSRTILHAENTVFFALVGIRNDGHNFIGELIAKGIRVFVVSRDTGLQNPENIALIEVDDTLDALQKLAAFHRSRFDFPVIGITGSNGKTVIKEWLNDLLSDFYSIARSPKSYNSQVGVPLSVWHIRHENNLGIFEAGISRPGEMMSLEKIIRPVIGIFSNIGDAHQENFRSVKQKISEKLLLFERCRKLIYCIDQLKVASMVREFCRGKGIEPVGWSLKNEKAGIRFRDFPENGGTRIEAKGKNFFTSFVIPFTDYSSIENCCHCFTAAIELNINPAFLSEKFRQLVPLSMRLELKKGINNCLLLNDFYNSDINSLEIALSVLNRQAEKNQLEKTVILSDIRQSGLPGHELYSQVNKLLVDAGVRCIIGIGGDISRASSLFSINKQFFPSTQEFISGLKSIGFSQAAILIKGARDFRFEDISSVLQQKAHLTTLEINLNALVDNLNIFKSLLSPGTRIMVMVKAFSYGSGDVEIAKLLQFQRVDYLAVAVTDEGKDLRNSGITVPIIVMNPELHSFQQMLDYNLEPNLYSVQLAEEFARAVDLNALQFFPVHLKIDTGMNRLGLKSEEEIRQIIELFRKNSQLRLQSLFSHLVASDDPAFDDFTVEQVRRFEQVCGQITGALGYPVMRHILNSAGIERFRQYQFEMVRLGIGLYGVSCAHLPLKAISRLKSTISQIKGVGPGETVGYNRSGCIERDSRIAVIPVGYADGLDRRLGNGRGKVFVNGNYAPFTGNICMDMCMADVTGIECKPGDEAEIFGENVTVSEVAAAAGTIPYEILTGISQRVKRVYIQE